MQAGPGVTNRSPRASSSSTTTTSSAAACAPSSAPMPSGRRGVRGRRRDRDDRRTRARRRARRRPHARRRRRSSDPGGARRATRHPLPRAVGLRRAGRRHRGDPRRRARLRHKTISGPELVDAIRRVAADDAVFSPRLAGFVLDAFSHVPLDAVDPELDQLTAREREVLRHIAAGTRTRRSPASSTSPPRRSRATCRRCCASSSSRTVTSSPAGRPSAASCDRGSVDGDVAPGEAPAALVALRARRRTDPSCGASAAWSSSRRT